MSKARKITGEDGRIENYFAYRWDGRPFPLIGGFLAVSVILMTQSSLTAAETDESFIARELERTHSDPDTVVTIAINAPVEFVFDLLLYRLEDYVTDAVNVAFDHADSASPAALDSGSERITTMENGEILVQRFLQFQPPQGFAYFTDMEQSTVAAPLRYSLARYELTDNGEGTVLRVAVVYQSSSRLLAFFVRRAFNSALQRDFEKAAAVIEAEYLANISLKRL